MPSLASNKPSNTCYRECCTRHLKNHNRERWVGYEKSDNKAIRALLTCISFMISLPLMGGGEDELRVLIQKLHPQVLILDTFTALVKVGCKSNSDVFRSQYAEVSVLRKIAEDFQIAVIVVHHVRKGVSDSAIEAVAGTNGLAAGVDTLWLLKRKPENEATLEVVGRETEERTYALRFVQEPFGWQVLGDDAMQLLNGERREVLDLLHEDGGFGHLRRCATGTRQESASRADVTQADDRGRSGEKRWHKIFSTHTPLVTELQSQCVHIDPWGTVKHRNVQHT